MSTSTFPITPSRLSQIASDACTSTLAPATSYRHDETAAWNNSIIQKILQALISESTPSENGEEETSGSRYKFAVNSTIIQHLTEPRAAEDSERSEVEHKDGLNNEEVSGEKGSEGKKVGRRGMHSASGAYWNNERDGMWSYKFEGGEEKGMDIVVSVMWIGV